MTFITSHQAYSSLQPLVTALTGFTDAAVDDYAARLQRKVTTANYAALLAAVEQVCETWGEGRRPPFKVLWDEFRGQVRRDSMDRPALPSGVGTIPVADGRRVAAREYQRLCEREGRAPSPMILDAFLGAVGDET